MSKIFIPLVVCLLVAPQPQSGRRTIWDGVYSQAQASSGEQLMGQCRGCHGAGMDGGQAPALRGEKWMDYWREDTLDSMYSMIKESMPPRATSTMTESQALAVVAYILQANNIPAGDADLGVNALPAIHIEARNGPQPLPTYSNVQIVGCTAKGDNEVWNIVSSTEPIRTRNAGRANEIELKAAAVKSLGAASFQLQNLAMAGITADSLQEGRKVLIKGVLMRQPAGDRISLNSLQELSPSCTK